MCGSGITIDVCEEEGGKAIGYDINPQHPKVIKNDSQKNSLDDNSVNMIFIDSPYRPTKSKEVQGLKRKYTDRLNAKLKKFNS